MIRSARTMAATAILACASWAGLAIADQSGKSDKPVPQKELAQPFLDGLVGSWSTQSKGVHEGVQMTGSGTSTWERGIGGTALLQTYEGSMPGPDGKMMQLHGHGVYKVSDDGKTATVWWFCNMSPDVMKLTGSATDSGIHLTGESPMGGKVDLNFEKSDSGLVFKMTEGTNELSETYKRK